MLVTTSITRQLTRHGKRYNNQRMKILCCYTQDKLRTETIDALSRFAPGCELTEVTGLYGYWEALADRWNSEDDLVIVEQDIVITVDVIPGFGNCDQDWCSFAYQVWCSRPLPPAVRLFDRGLGCTRFSAELQRRFPLRHLALKVRWQRIDAVLCEAFDANNLAPHVHGEVGHLHEYPGEFTERRH